MSAVTVERFEIHPQPGPQTAFLSTPADIAVMGGAAGGGKTYGLLLDPLRHYTNPHFGGTIFRRTSVQVRVEGGLWDTSMGLYPRLGGRPREHSLEWRFPSGMGISFANLEFEKDVYNYQGAQIPWMGFDELTHFTRFQFFYMLSRNRSTSGVRSVIRAGCNPDPDSWVKTFIRWWLDERGQFPDPLKSGVLRWFIMLGNELHWGSTKQEMHERFGDGPEIQPLSVTFIPSKLEDNEILMRRDPKYKANLLALSAVDRARLLHGDWLVRANAGTMFRREWFRVVDTVPGGFNGQVRFWDRAATRPHHGNTDPDWTRGIRMLRYPNGRFLIADIKSTRDTPGQVETLIRNVASHDGVFCQIRCQQDPGSAGVAEAEYFVRMLNGFDVRTEPFFRDKVTRAKPFSAQCEAGNVDVLRGEWNDDFFEELENFGEDSNGHDDIVDACSGAHNALSESPSMFDVL